MSSAIVQGAGLEFTVEECALLMQWARSGGGSEELGLRSRIVLACAVPGVTDEMIGANLEVPTETVETLRAHFTERRLAALTG